MFPYQFHPLFDDIRLKGKVVLLKQDNLIAIPLAQRIKVCVNEDTDLSVPIKPQIFLSPVNPPENSYLLMLYKRSSIEGYLTDEDSEKYIMWDRLSK